MEFENKYTSITKIKCMLTYTIQALKARENPPDNDCLKKAMLKHCPTSTIGFKLLANGLSVQCYYLKRKLCSWNTDVEIEL